MDDMNYEPVLTPRDGACMYFPSRTGLIQSKLCFARMIVVENSCRVN